MSLERVREMYLALNGDHPMSDADDAYVRRHFVEIPETAELPRGRVLELIAERRLPLPSYWLDDGTPMVHPDFLELFQRAGSPEALRAWFLDQWPSAGRAVAEEEWDDGYLSGQYVCLWTVTPTTIQAKTRTIEEIRAEMAAIDAGEGSRERLAAAVDRLDELEPPFTGYDHLRFAGRTSRDVWIDDVRATYLAGAATPLAPRP